VRVLVVLPFTMSFGRRSGRSIFALTGGSFSCYHSGDWGRGTSGDTTVGRGIRVVLIWTLVAITRRPCSVLDNWPNFGRRACWATVMRDRSLIWSLVHRPGKTNRRRGWWRGHAASMRTVIGV
jgi:hypothetical protein